MYRKIFVSGCYDILHAGHVQFFEQAKSLGDHLTVCFASDKVLFLAKKRKPSLPESHKAYLIGSLRCVDKVLKSSNLDPVFDFYSHIKREKPDILAVTEDDKNKKKKKDFCKKLGIEFVILPKANKLKEKTSTTKILEKIKGKEKLKLKAFSK